MLHTTLGELISHRHGREGAARGGFVEKTEQKQGSFSFVRRRASVVQAEGLALCTGVHAEGVHLHSSATCIVSNRVQSGALSVAWTVSRSLGWFP